MGGSQYRGSQCVLVCCCAVECCFSFVTGAGVSERTAFRARIHDVLAMSDEVAYDATPTDSNVKKQFLKTRSDGRLPFLVRAASVDSSPTPLTTSIPTWQKYMVRHASMGLRQPQESADAPLHEPVVDAASQTDSEAPLNGFCLPVVDVASLTDLASFLLRGGCLREGELALQQRIGSYLIDSPFCPTLSGSTRLKWFACVWHHIVHAPIITASVTTHAEGLTGSSCARTGTRKWGMF